MKLSYLTTIRGFVLILSISLVFLAIAGCAENGNDQHQPVTQELIQLVESNSEIRSPKD